MKSKVLRVLAYMSVIVFLLFLILGLQLSVIANKTFLSSKYFYNAFENSNAKSDLTVFILSSVKGDSRKIDSSTKKAIEDIIGGSVKGIYSFVIGDLQELPVINLSNYRNEIKGFLVSSIENRIDKDRILREVELSVKYLENNPDTDVKPITLYTHNKRNLEISRDTMTKAKGEVLKNKALGVKNDPTHILNLVIDDKVDEIIGKGNIGLKFDLNSQGFSVTSNVSEKSNMGITNRLINVTNIIIFALIMLFIFIGLNYLEKRLFIRISSICLFVLVLLELVIAVLFRFTFDFTFFITSTRVNASLIELIYIMVQGFFNHYIAVSIILLALSLGLFISSFFVKQGVGLNMKFSKVNKARYGIIFAMAGFTAGCYMLVKIVKGIMHTVNLIHTISTINFEDIINIFFV